MLPAQPEKARRGIHLLVRIASDDSGCQPGASARTHQRQLERSKLLRLVQHQAVVTDAAVPAARLCVRPGSRSSSKSTA